MHTRALVGVAVALAVLSLAACGGTSASRSGFFDSRGNVEEPGWDMQLAKESPDGNRLAVIGVDPDGHWQVGLASNGTLTKLPVKLDGAVAEDIAWMPDSEDLLVAVNSLSGSRSTVIDCVRVDGTTCAAPAIGGAWRHSNRAGMDVSPDGSTLAVQGHSGTTTPDGAPSQIFIVSLSHPALTPLASDRVSRTLPQWLDSTHVAFLAGTPAAAGATPRDATVEERSLGDAHDTPVSPAGAVVDELGGNGGTLVFHTVAASGANPRGMYEVTGPSGSPHFLGDFVGDHPELSTDTTFLIFTTALPKQSAYIGTVSIGNSA